MNPKLEFFGLLFVTPGARIFAHFVEKSIQFSIWHGNMSFQDDTPSFSTTFK